MKNFRYFVLLLICFVFIFSSCGNDSVTNTNPPANNTINVNGKIVDLLGNPASGISVIIGGQVVTSAADGKFTIDNVTKPYDCKMLDLSSPTKKGYIYKGLNSVSPVLTASFELFAFEYTSTVNITLPAGLVPAGKRIMIFYADTTNVIFSKIYNGPVTAPISLPIAWANNNSTINGKIFALVYSVNVSNEITSYDNYGETDIPVTNGGSSVWQPLLTDFALNPGEANLTAAISIPAGYIFNSAKMVINFSKLTNNPLFAILLNSQIAIFTGVNISTIVPTGLPSGFTINLFSQYAEPSGASGRSSAIVQAGSNQITLDPSPLLNSPLNGSTGIDTNSVFNYSQGTGSGVFQLYFSDSGIDRDFYVYTTDLNATIPNFSPDLTLGSNLSYTWSVTKMQGVNSVDEFVKTELYHRTDYRDFLISASRTFTSAP